jgi:hypothetical protein
MPTLRPLWTGRILDLTGSARSTTSTSVPPPANRAPHFRDPPTPFVTPPIFLAW